ncbi:MAG: hypothetical protein C0631_04105 [Sedimenticola sp.]|nr:MAG: hypothetical protein C0631_04105 [Sedimenticola sp.]
MGYFYIFGTILFTVYGQLILKWRVGIYGALPETFSGKLAFIFRALMDPFILSGLFAAFIASLFWMAAVTKFQLSYAYPFMSLAFVIVLALSALLFREPLTLPKLVGMALIVGGITIGSQG